MMMDAQMFRSLKMILGSTLGLVLLTVQAYAATKEPTLSIPRDNPVKPTCVGWGAGEGCAESITDALKNAGRNKTIFVKAGSGIADNLVISKGVTICAAHEKNTCIKDPASKDKFRLIRKSADKPCIRIAFTSAPGKVTFIGMEIRDVEERITCITNTSRHAGSSTLTIDRSIFENVELKLSGLNAFSVNNTRIAHTYDSEELTTWSLSKGGSATFKEGVSVSAVDLHINDLELDLTIEGYEFGNIQISGGETSKISLGDFRYGILSLTGAGSSEIAHSSFRKAELVVKDAAIRTIRDNYFTDSEISLEHTGLVTFENNVVETAPYGAIFGDKISLSVVDGVNRISGNHFGSECNGLPSESGSTCGCSGSPTVMLSQKTSGPTTKLSDNKICSAKSRWIASEIGLDETFRGNCAMTRQSKIGKASKSFYRSTREPLKSELLVTFVDPGRSPRNISPDCLAFMR